MNYSHTTILITGATSGIGKALALHYAEIGVVLCLTGRDKKRLSDVTTLCEEKGATVKSTVCDVTNQDKLKRWITKIDGEHDIDLIIANAGISGGTSGHTHTEPVSQARQIFDTNLTGVLNTIDPVLDNMIKRRKGQIAIVSSLAGYSGWPGAPAYSASKAAVRIYAEGLRPSLRRYNVKINVICPGFIRTPMTEVNDYSMPFMITADKAAKIIGKGLKRNKGRICFPWPTYLTAGFMGLLPYWLSSFMMRDLPGKPALDSAPDVQKIE